MIILIICAFSDSVCTQQSFDRNEFVLSVFCWKQANTDILPQTLSIILSFFGCRSEPQSGFILNGLYCWFMWRVKHFQICEDGLNWLLCSPTLSHPHPATPLLPVTPTPLPLHYHQPLHISIFSVLFHVHTVAVDQCCCVLVFVHCFNELQQFVSKIVKSGLKLERVILR